MSNNSPYRSFPYIPFELIILIAENLCLSDVRTLLQVSRSFWELLVRMVNRAALQPKYRKIAFYWAAVTRNRDLMSMLIESGRNFMVKRADSDVIIFRPPVNHTFTAALVKVFLELDGKIYVQDMFDLCTPLHEAARLGQNRVLDMVLETGTASLDVEDIRGWTPLFHAVWQGNVYAVKQLVKQGCNINTMDCHQMTPLHLAALQGDPAVVKILLDSGADCNIVDARGWTAIEMREYTYRNNDVVQKMILQKLKPSYVSSLSQTALHMAVIFQDLEMAVHFLDQGVRVNDTDILGCTALHDAVVYGHKGMVDLLLSRGAAVDIMDSAGKTPLHRSLLNWSRNICPIAWALLDRGADVRLRDNEGNSVFDNMVSFDVFQTNTDKLLLQRLLEGMDIDFISKYGGSTLLNIAVEFGNEDCVRVLLDKGADVNDYNQEGITALHQAVSLKKPESLIKLLLDRGADPSSTTLRGYTVMDVAFFYGYLNTPLLDIALANPHVRSRYRDQTYLHLAVRALDITKVKRFIDAGIDINAQDLWGQTPLHLAVMELGLDIISLLIDCGADTNIRDYNGLTPLAELLQVLDPTNTIVPLDLVMLLAEGVDLDIKDIEGNTILDLARKYKHYDAADLLMCLKREGCTIVGVDYCNDNFRRGVMM